MTGGTRRAETDRVQGLDIAGGVASMTVPSQMSLRRIPDAMHLPVRVAYATSWEALIDTHARQALQFVPEFAARKPELEGLDLYFRVTAVPESMHEVVRSRTL